MMVCCTDSLIERRARATEQVQRSERAARHLLRLGGPNGTVVRWIPLLSCPYPFLHALPCPGLLHVPARDPLLVLHTTALAPVSFSPWKATGHVPRPPPAAPRPRSPPPPRAPPRPTPRCRCSASCSFTWSISCSRRVKSASSSRRSQNMNTHGFCHTDVLDLEREAISIESGLQRGDSADVRCSPGRSTLAASRTAPHPAQPQPDSSQLPSATAARARTTHSGSLVHLF